ncbi:MAG: chromosome segregation protein SMC [Clostridiales bacterium]|nr:chromosome segregation protein SMC [Clostridiales bacterium]
MYLKELDLQGFKSFPEKVKLEFNKGITAVVGPNGSGKSNISDAVRWVLGEQKPKSLRGGKMEDVIFAGTAARKPVGFAEVSMTIDNTDKKIPVEYSEIKITRRVYRSGESGYLINGTECRLKDIYELFMDTGIGRDGYSIIGQGKIDEILSNKSGDRRQLFEEAAGIVKYKNRRNEAEAKLEKEQQNLVRITDIISEIESKIEPLEKQAEKAKKYLELYGRIKEADIMLFKINGEKLEKSIGEVTGLIENSNIDIADNEEKLEKLKAEAESIKANSQGMSVRIEQINRDIADLSGEIEKNDGICRLTAEQIRNIDASSERLKGEGEETKSKAEENAKAISDLTEVLKKADEDIESMKALLGEKEKALSILLEKQTEREEKIEDYKSEMIEKIKRTANIKSTIERTEAVLEQYQARKKQLLQDRADTQNRLKDKRIQAKSAELRAESSAENAEDIKSEIARLESRKAAVMKIVSIIDEGLSEKTQKLAEKESKLRVLTDMEKEHDGYYKSVKAILRLRDGENPDFKGVRGAVAQLLKTDEKYETAIETALGGTLQSIVVEKESDAKTAVNYLKKNQLGRATFLPMATVKGRTLGAEKSVILGEKGVIAAASDIVKYDKEYAGIAESLLGRIVVIDTMENAIAFARKYKQGYRLVTLDGELFMPGGAITGGSTGRRDGGVFGRKREMDSLKTETESLKAACEGLTAEKDKNLSKAEEYDEEIEDKKEEAKEADIDYITANQELERIKKETEEYDEKLKAIETEESRLEEQSSAAEEERQKAKEELLSTENEISELQNMLNEYKENSESGKSGRDIAAEEITALKVDISSASERRQAAADNMERLNAEKASLAEKIESISAEIEANAVQKEEKQALADKAAENTVSSRKRKKEKEQELEKVSEDRRKENDRLSAQEEKLNTCRDTILKYKNELVRLEAKAEKLSEERKHLNDDMWESYEITYPEAVKIQLSDEPVSEISKRARELKSEIKSLGAVNVHAVDEYKETKERYEFLTKQKNDIIDAEEKLKGIIHDLSGLMEKQFREKLEIISENFNEVFREMFGGGRAYLKLSDEDDVLESGIEIIAQPPGKNLQNMTLLSGGERALTAIAILFSILKMKPSPFCILDEIEAALDDANVQRFGDYLKRFSEDTQFIVITHRKGTMEAADVLYGVTMQEQGISKIVSVKFDEAVGR